MLNTTVSKTLNFFLLTRKPKLRWTSDFFSESRKILIKKGSIVIPLSYPQRRNK